MSEQPATTHAEVLAGLAALEATLDAGTGGAGPWFDAGDDPDVPSMARVLVIPGAGIVARVAQNDAALIVAAVNTLRASIDLARLVAHRHAPDSDRIECIACGFAHYPCDQYRAAALVAGVAL